MTSMNSTYESIEYKCGDRIARITLNRPEKRNALSYQLRRELVDALRAAEQDDEVTVILIDGAGPSFCSGYDVTPNTDRGTPPEGWVSSRHFDSWTDQFARSCLRDWLTMWDLLKPVVVKVHGYCLAGGTEIMSMADIAFVAEDASIGYPPMRGQTTPDTPYFPWKMTMAQAKYLQLTGNSISGKEAADMGWVAKSFPEDELDAAVESEIRAAGKHRAGSARRQQAVGQSGLRDHGLPHGPSDRLAVACVERPYATGRGRFCQNLAGGGAEGSHRVA